MAPRLPSASPLSRSERGFGPREDRHRFEVCQKTCQGRPGRTILRVNKQIYGEALPLFPERNEFCYISARAFNANADRISPSALNHIRRLSITQDRTDAFEVFVSGYVRGEYRDALWNKLRRFRAHELAIMTLRKLRATYFNQVGSWPHPTLARPEQEFTYILLHGDLEVPECCHLDTDLAVRMQVEVYRCFWCDWRLVEQCIDLGCTFYDGIGSKPETLTMHCWRAAIGHIHSNGLALPHGQPMNVKLQLEDDSAQQFMLLGLPRLNEMDRQRFEDADKLRESRAKASTASKVRSQPGINLSEECDLTARQVRQ